LAIIILLLVDNRGYNLTIGPCLTSNNISDVSYVHRWMSQIMQPNSVQVA